MTLADATALIYGPVPMHDVVIDIDGQLELEHLKLDARELSRVLATETRPCMIFVDGLLVRRVKP